MSGKESANTSSWARKIAIGTTSGAILIAALGLIAYIPGLGLLGSVRLEFIPMAPSTAIFFISLGFIILANLKPIKPLPAYFCITYASAISIFGLIKFVEYCCAVEVDKSFEQFIVPNLGMLGEIPIGIMSPATGAVFFPAGLGAVLLSLKNAGHCKDTLVWNLAGIAGCLVAGGGLVFVLGYAYGAPLLYTRGSTIPMAITTATAFMLLGTGITSAAGRESFPLADFAGPSVSAMMMRIFVPLVCIAILFADFLQHMMPVYFPLHPDSVTSAVILIIFMIITAMVTGRLGSALGGRIEKLEEERFTAILDLKNNEALFSTQFEVANVGLAITSLDNKWVKVNTRLCNILGYTAEELGQKTWVELTHPDDLNTDLENFNKVVSGEINGYELDKRFIRKNLNIAFVHLTVGCVRNPDRSVKYFIASLDDITEQKKIEQELADYRVNLEKTVEARTGELVATRRELHDARRLADIGALSATLAHEIRNPLAGIKAATYLIAKKTQNKVLDKHIAVINKKIGECDHIIRNFLGYARIAMPKHEPIIIAKVLQECLSSLKLKYSNWDAAVHVKFNCEKNQIIEADPFHLAQLLMNIVDNAYMSFENKAGTIDITFDCDEKADCLVIHVKDDGCGIAEENIPKLFDPFFTTRARGVGLGLSVCKQVVDLHRGKIDVKSRIGKGTDFSIVLPLRKGQECLYDFG